MCNQTVCLLAAELERHGVATVVIQLLRFVAEKVQPPRALFVPFRHGYPLGQPDAPAQQKSVLKAALNLLNSRAEVPILADYQPGRQKSNANL